jgi:hypothetical protein
MRGFPLGTDFVSVYNSRAPAKREGSRTYVRQNGTFASMRKSGRSFDSKNKILRKGDFYLRSTGRRSALRRPDFWIAKTLRAFSI